MKEWLSAREIAQFELRDLPASERGVQILAAREGWNDHPTHCRTRRGSVGGGGKEYHYALLPTLAQIDYVQRRMTVGAASATVDPAPDLAANIPAKAAAERDARLAVVNAFEKFRAGLSIGQASCLQVFVDRYNMGSIAVDDWIKEILPRLSKRSLQRWTAARRDGDTSRLAVDRGAARKGKGALETANGGSVRAFILALVAHQPHLSAAHIRTLCRDEFGETVTITRKGAAEAIDLPPVRTFQHFLKALKESERVVLTKLSNPDRYRSTMAPAGTGSLRHVTEPNALWQIDASPVDALCTDGRHSIYACVDIASRRTCWYVSRTPRAAAVALLIRKAILAWGVPQTIKTDNGSDFVAQDTRRLFAALGIEMELSDAYAPQQKGHVERAIRTFQHDCATLLPGFVGHSVADRKQIEDRKSFADRLGADTAAMFGVSMTGADLQTYVDQWAAAIYEHREHGGLKGRTPAQAAAECSVPIRTVDARALDVLLMPVAGKDGMRTVTKFGIRIDHFHYVVHNALPGTPVFVRMDPADMGRAYAFDAEDGRFVGEAICAELSGLHPATIMAAKREAQAAALAQATAEAKTRIREITKGKPLIERALAVAARDLPNVVALPKRHQAHETPEIAAALDAQAPVAPTVPLGGRAAEIHAAMKAEAAKPAEPEGAAVTVLRKQETPQFRFRRALDLEKAIAAGEPVDAAEAMWLGGYRAGPEYRALRGMHEDFGQGDIGG